MKYLKIATIVFIVGLVLQVYVYVNLKSLYKDEVEWNTSFVQADANLSIQQKSKRVAEIEVRRKEINGELKQTNILFWSFLIGLIIISFFRMHMGNTKKTTSIQMTSIKKNG